MPKSTELALWGGHECTVNRIGDAYHDQTRRSGHHERIEDLDRFAALGVKSLRYPVLWERVCPDTPEQHDWAWSDVRLARLQDLGIKPIVGLLHHGSGPAHTGLLDERFSERFARFAGAVAERYPWVVDWTPVNEPVTTARFTCLYGHWHPHLRDEREFWRCLLNQIDGTIGAMRAIRAVNPDARLIQTDDLGKTYATPELAHQAGFDNARRWMSWDLLEGRVTPQHPLWDRLCGFGFRRRLEAIGQAPCPPDVVGVNHYVTSDRFLDHRVERYPVHTVGGNDFMTFADVEAVRVAIPSPQGLDGAVREAWDRYGRTIAVTECHIGCSREEQLRWLYESWATLNSLRDEGVEIEALTAWSLLGAYDWASLLTRQEGAYEVGAFDVSAAEPRPTAIATALRTLAGGAKERPFAGPGWWRRDIRIHHQPVCRGGLLDEAPPGLRPAHIDAAPLLVIGDGPLSKAFAAACEWRAMPFQRVSAMTVTDLFALESCLDHVAPWGIVNTSRYDRADAAETDARRCFALNVRWASDLATAAAERGVRLLGFSTDLIFDGAAGRPYTEHDAPHPLSILGLSMAQGETATLAACSGALIARTGPLFGPNDPENFPTRTLRALLSGAVVTAQHDRFVSPTYLPDLAEAALDLLIDGESGVWHMANQGGVSWAGFAAQLAASIGCPELVVETPTVQTASAPRRAFDTRLRTLRGSRLPSVENAIGRFLAASGLPPRVWPLATMADIAPVEPLPAL